MYKDLYFFIFSNNNWQMRYIYFEGLYIGRLYIPSSLMWYMNVPIYF